VKAASAHNRTFGQEAVIALVRSFPHSHSYKAVAVVQLTSAHYRRLWFEVRFLEDSGEITRLGGSKTVLDRKTG
jgi:hypothetical protein